MDMWHDVQQKVARCQHPSFFSGVPYQWTNLRIHPLKLTFCPLTNRLGPKMNFHLTKTWFSGAVLVSFKVIQMPHQYASIASVDILYATCLQPWVTEQEIIWMTQVYQATYADLLTTYNSRPSSSSSSSPVPKFFPSASHRKWNSSSSQTWNTIGTPDLSTDEDSRVAKESSGPSTRSVPRLGCTPIPRYPSGKNPRYALYSGYLWVYTPQESLENMGTLLGVHPIVDWVYPSRELNT